MIEFGPEFERAILKARTARELERLVPTLLLTSANHPSLDSLSPAWNPVTRIGRALRAGISAHRVLTGQFPKQAQSPSLPFKNEVYICLRCLRIEEGWWTRDYEIYFLCIENPHSEGVREIQQYSVSHSFPTLAEAEVFLRGARRQWPRELSPHDL